MFMTRQGLGPTSSMLGMLSKHEMKAAYARFEPPGDSNCLGNGVDTVSRLARKYQGGGGGVYS